MLGGMLMIGAAVGLVYLWATGALRELIATLEDAAGGKYAARARGGDGAEVVAP